MLQIYDKPKRANFADVLEKPFATLLLSLVSNPRGPTCTVACAAGTVPSGQSLDLLVFTLNPFEQTIAKIGEVDLQQAHLDRPNFDQLFELDFGDCPNVAFTSGLFDQAESTEVVRDWLMTFEDAGAFFSDVSRYPDPVERISEQMRRRQPRPVTQIQPREAEILAERMSNGQILHAEFNSFIGCWMSAIRGSQLPKEEVLDAMVAWASIDRAMSTCRKPSPDDIHQ